MSCGYQIIGECCGLGLLDRGVADPHKNKPIPICVTTPNLVILHQMVLALSITDSPPPKLGAPILVYYLAKYEQYMQLCSESLYSFWLTCNQLLFHRLLQTKLGPSGFSLSVLTAIFQVNLG